MPALFTRHQTSPCSSSIAAIAAYTASLFVTSTTPMCTSACEPTSFFTAATVPSRSLLLRSQMTTRAPLAAKQMAAWRPTPPPPPVIRHSRPLTLLRGWAKAFEMPSARAAAPAALATATCACQRAWQSQWVGRRLVRLFLTFFASCSCAGVIDTCICER